MLPPFIIEQLREREERARRELQREQPRLELPVPGPPVSVGERPAPEEKGERGISEIQIW